MGAGPRGTARRSSSWQELVKPKADCSDCGGDREAAARRWSGPDVSLNHITRSHGRRSTADQSGRRPASP
jgi:hypothetical protein